MRKGKAGVEWDSGMVELNNNSRAIKHIYPSDIIPNFQIDVFFLEQVAGRMVGIYYANIFICMWVQNFENYLRLLYLLNCIFTQFNVLT